MGQRDLGAWMIATTDPILGGNIPLSWGHAVFSDLSAISNVSSVFGVAPSPAYTNGTTSFTNIGSWTLGLTKTSSTSKLVCVLFVSGFFTVASGQLAHWAINVDGTDYPAAQFYFNATADHRQITGGVVIPNLTSGPKTLQVRGRVTTATSTLNHDTNDRMAMIVLEIP